VVLRAVNAQGPGEASAPVAVAMMFASFAATYCNGNLEGDTTLASVTLSSDRCFRNLTVPAGVTVHANGYRIFVSGTLTLDGTTHNGLWRVYAGTGTIGDPAGSNSNLLASAIGGNGDTSVPTGGTPPTPATGALALTSGTRGGGWNTGGGVVLVSANMITGSGTLRSDAAGEFNGWGGGGAVLAITANGHVDNVGFSVNRSWYATTRNGMVRVFAPTGDAVISCNANDETPACGAGPFTVPQ
jgi:hypothetical protein